MGASVLGHNSGSSRLMPSIEPLQVLGIGDVVYPEKSRAPFKGSFGFKPALRSCGVQSQQAIWDIPLT